jgi:hypothetical protein
MLRRPSNTSSWSPSSCGAAHEDWTFAHCVGSTQTHHVSPAMLAGIQNPCPVRQVWTPPDRANCRAFECSAIRSGRPAAWLRRPERPRRVTRCTRRSDRRTRLSWRPADRTRPTGPDISSDAGRAPSALPHDPLGDQHDGDSPHRHERGYLDGFRERPAVQRHTYRQNEHAQETCATNGSSAWEIVHRMRNIGSTPSDTRPRPFC